MRGLTDRSWHSGPMGNRLWRRVTLCYESEQLLWLIILVGLLLRCHQYLFNRSLWVDEAALALNVINRSFLQLLTPLDYSQGAPIGFLMTERLVVQALGTSSYALRLFPLLSAVVSLLLFRKVAKLCITATAAPLALGLFALSEPLIYYASEVKQYSSDVLITLILYCAAMSLKSDRLTASRTACLGLAGAVAIWFSHPAVFILAGIGISLVALRLAEKDWSAVRRLMAICSLWGLSIATAYVLSLRHLAGNRYLLDWWSNYFLPFPPSSASELTWPVWSFFEVFQNPARFVLPGLAAFAFLAGCYWMFLREKRALLLLLSPMPFAILASILHLYPLGSRLLLYAVPTLVLLVAVGAECVRVSTAPGSRILWMTLVGLLILHPLANAGNHLIRPRTVEEIEPVLGYIAENWRDGDLLYVYYYARHPFEYYAPAYGLHNKHHITGIRSHEDWDNYAQDLERLRGHSRVWLVFSHVYRQSGVDEEKLFLYFLDGMGTRLDSHTAPGAAAYLYDLSRPPNPE